MQAGKKDIEGIFNKSWELIIPFFQRPYVWGSEQWDRFLSDMYDICQYEQEYFLGSLILKKESDDTGNKIVVDGQQRLTTLILFFKVLLLKQDNNQEFDGVFKKRDDKNSILKHNKNDRKSFELVLGLALLQRIDNPNNQIEKCYHYFIDHIEEDRLNFAVLLKYIAFVAIELEVYENEQQIFDTVNSFGVDLTTAELLKNHFFKSDEIELYDKHWQPIFETDNETIAYWNTKPSKDGKTLIDIFFFSFLQIKSKNLTTKDRNGFGQISNLYNSYKRFFKHIDNKVLFFAELSRYANLFRQYINPNIGADRLTTQMDRINLIIFEGKLFSIIPYVVFVLSHYEYAPEQRDEILFVLESYLMRRMVGIDKSTFATKLYHDLFDSHLIINGIVSANALKIHFNGYKHTHLNYLPTDNEIKYLLKNKAQTQKRALLVFYLLDNMKRQAQNLEHLYGFDKYSADYFMPIKWQKNWSRPLDEATRQMAVKTLGNMTITPQKLNNVLKDATWYERVHGRGKMKGLLAHNHLHIAKPILQKSEWTDDDIFRNNERLAKLICDVWKLS